MMDHERFELFLSMCELRVLLLGCRLLCCRLVKQLKRGR